ncbi:putative nucleolar complex protein 14 [Cyphellophora attinorum]|uniref:Putative nucleolar complex protein 14 n=1 Tax=Cyphellophora attinorum TaxID=1664694 RepID=A0A0N0NIC4_9EURO|nr:putative nucleolar complex protein 14 [Phialophora attinorum]KPI35578.1 putative nucleolar complex protein 14 [Phialophora attinorum]
MAPSQLKQLKASLRDSGVLGPQKSKKQQKASAKDAQKRLQRSAALEGIRDKFNPFEVKAPARRPKHEFVSSKEQKTSIGRPGVTRGLGEERRRETLLREIQSRNKVGGLLDRRFGENDPTLTPEQRAAERFARQNERKSRKTAMFNLEDDSEEEMALTHAGRSLEFGENVVEDYEKDDMDRSSDDDEQERPRKRMRVDEEGASEEEQVMPERKKTKNEVMQEVIAKSKMHKAERQAAKADDEDLRMELDKGMDDLYEAMRGHKPPPRHLPTPPSDSEPQMDPSRAAMLAGKSREEAEKEYEANIRQMKMDARSKPSVRTKTDEEKAAEEADRLRELERQRQRRMQGEAESSEDEDNEGEPAADADEIPDDAEAFGLSAPEPVYRPDIDVEDEDEFVLDDLVASGSDLDMASDHDDDDSDDSQAEDADVADDGDDDFINGLVLPKQPQKSESGKSAASRNDLAFTYPCPQSHEEFLAVIEGKDLGDIPTIVQRTRALYHKRLAEGNEEKLGKFVHVLVDHIAYMGEHEEVFQQDVSEALIRHLHSMAKSQPQEAARAFRIRLQTISQLRPLNLTAGDLLVFTAAMTIFPTSDQFHTVITPSLLAMGRYLGQGSIQSLNGISKGLYCCTLCLQYQRLANRYVPEAVNYLVNVLAILSPVVMPEKTAQGQPLGVLVRLPGQSLRITLDVLKAKAMPTAGFQTLVLKDGLQPSASIQLLHLAIRLAYELSELWSQKTAWSEIVEPILHALSHLQTSKLPRDTQTLIKTTLSSLQTSQIDAIANRKPLLLHNHRPLAIKQSIPQFTDNYIPTKHYDPDAERAQLSKLKAEHKKERKGAMRELRKDANFIAREQLREKKEKDEAYDKKFKRLVAEIQGEEGREAKEYEREKRKRKGK